MPDERYRGWLYAYYATASSQRWLAVVAKSCGSFSPIPIFPSHDRYQEVARGTR